MAYFDRRHFIKTGAGAILAAGVPVTACGGRAGAQPSRHADADVAVPPYENTIRDRLWMWGHSGIAFDKPRFTYDIPAAPPIEMNEACRYMGIPNVCVCRYVGLPEVQSCSAYLKTFKDIKRIVFSIVDGAGGFKLACVIYPDSDGIKPAFKEVLDLCDQISVWFWHAKNIPTMKAGIRKLRDLVGPKKALIMGIYMWDFGDRRPVPDDLMRQQLETGRELMAARQLSGLVFHPTSLVNRKLSSIEIARKWIAENGDCAL